MGLGGNQPSDPIFVSEISTMKKLLSILFAVVVPVLAHANVFQVKNLNASGSAVILVPGAYAQVIIIQNNGSNSVRLSLDGGAGYLDPLTNKYGTNPTPTTGYLLPAGQQITITTQPQTTGSVTQGIHKPIVAEMVTGTTQIDIITDDNLSTCPST